MNADDLTGLTITKAARLIRTRKVSATELTRATLARIEKVDGHLKSFITVTADLALKQARKADRDLAAGSYKGPLHGIPVSLKDLYWTKGIRTTAGSKILGDFIPTTDATSVRRLADAGAVLVGKANLHEFAIGATTDNPFYGTCRNPWKAGYIPGGSSGGSAASVSAGLGLASLGSDTGGSIRIPASFCGVVGLKPTYGVIPRTGIVPDSLSLDHAGPITRTAADAAAVLQAIAGPDGIDPSAMRDPLPPARRARGKPLQGLRIGVPTNYYWDIIVPEVEKLAREGIDELRRLGARIVPIEVPLAETALDTCLLVAWSESATYHRQWLLDRPQDYGADTLEYLTGALLFRATDYLQAQRVRRRFRESFKDVFRKVDLIASSTGAIPASPLGQVEFVMKGKKFAVLSVMARLTCIANLTGEPACSFPCGFTKAGLPVGMMIHGPVMSDLTVLRVGQAYDQATGWTEKTPPIGN